MNGPKLENIKSNINAQENNKMTKDELFVLRKKQSGASRLAEYITGLRPDDPKMMERLLQDQKIIRAKYHLPTTEERFQYIFDSIDNYEKILIARAEEVGYVVENNPHLIIFEKIPSGGIHDGGNQKIFLKINKTNRDSFIKGIITLEHELIHALQPDNMPIELKEYEAHVGTRSLENYLYNDPKKTAGVLEEVLFGIWIGRSVGSWYRLNDTKSTWNNPEWFLKNIDGLSEEDIEEYNNKKAQ